MKAVCVGNNWPEVTSPGEEVCRDVWVALTRGLNARPGGDLTEQAVGSHGRLDSFCWAPLALSEGGMRSFGGGGSRG